MNVYPLAIYTANHGLAWHYPKEEISFLELDACRKAFGRLPDFGSGEKGFDGIWAKGKLVFVMRCQSVSAWDFRGRSATYLAVTWIPRSEAAVTDFDKLLDSVELSEPMKNPPAFFSADAVAAASRDISAVPLNPYLPDGFAHAGAIIAGTPLTTTVALKRIAGNSQASLTLSCHNDGGKQPATTEHRACTDSQVGSSQQFISSPMLGVFLATWFATIAAAVFLWMKWQTARARIEELEKTNSKLQESIMVFPNAHRTMPCPNPLLHFEYLIHVPRHNGRH